MPSTTLVGVQPKPRTVLIGSWTEDEVSRLKTICPTLELSDQNRRIDKQFSVREVDLILLSSASVALLPEIGKAHTIVFDGQDEMCGPVENSFIGASATSLSHQYHINDDLPQALKHALFRRDLGSAKDRHALSIRCGNSSRPYDKDAAEAWLHKGAAIIADDLQLPLAIVADPTKSRAGFAWIETDVGDRVACIKSIAKHWSTADPESLPLQTDWQAEPAWMTPDELRISADIQQNRARGQRVVSRLRQREAELENALTSAAEEASTTGLRGVLTHKGDELVGAVARALESLGFKVTDMDASIASGAPKVEDLRLQVEPDPGWEAIVEVRGYDRSAGKTADLQRLQRFAALYRTRTGQEPSKMIYVVNGEIALPSPADRHAVLQGADEDLELFAESGGVALSTTDLFKMARDVDELGPQNVRSAIMKGLGRLTLDDVPKSADDGQASAPT